MARAGTRVDAPVCRGVDALTSSFALCATALLVEALVGYPNWLFRAIGHPVTWIGAAIAWLDRQGNERAAAANRRRNGVLAVALLLVACLCLAGAAQALLVAGLPRFVAFGSSALIASTLLAQRSLDTHVRVVADALEHDGLDAGRAAVSMIVGRDTRTLDRAGVARAAIESLAENFSDGIVAPALWLALLGLPGGLAYKAINTADSMIGHRTPRHEAFGFAAAKLDDGVNWPAARLAAVWITLAATLVPGGSARDAWRIARRDARGHPSPNAGWPEAAMAGALGIRLGGPRSYGGRMTEDAPMGEGTEPVDASMIRRALTLYRVACALNLAAIAGVAILVALVNGRGR